MRMNDMLEPGEKWSLVLLGLTLAILLSPDLQAQETDVPDHIMTTVRADPRVKDILTDFPEVRLEPRLAREHGIWIVHLVHADKGRVGLVTVAPETGEILEFTFEPEQVRERERRRTAARRSSGCRQRPLSPGRLPDRARPGRHPR